MVFARHVTWRNEKFGAVIFDTLNEKVFVTNETGRDILQLVNEGLGISSITERLEADYGNHGEDIQVEVLSFINELWSAGLIVLDEEEKHEQTP